MTAFNVLEYLPEERLDLVIKEMMRVSRLKVFVTVANPDFSRAGMGAGDVVPEHMFPEPWWLERLEALGMMPTVLRKDMYMGALKSVQVSM